MLFVPKPNQNNFRWNADADGKAVPNPRPIGNVQLHITHRVQPGDESLVKTRHQPVKPYPSEYRECTVQARKEIQEGGRPELAAKVEDMGKYDVIFIGSPNWWSTIAPPVASFLASYDLSGKTVIPFVTHGGGGMARCADEVRKLCPKSTVLKGGAFAGEGIRTTRAALVKWVNETISINK